MTRVPTGSFSNRKSSPYAMRRRSDRRLVVITRSLRAPMSCFRSAVFNSFSFASGRAIRPSLRLYQTPHIVGDDVAAAAILFQMYDRPLPAHRSCAQPLVGIHRNRMAEGIEERQVVVRIGIAPAISELHAMLRGVLLAPDRFFRGRHNRLAQAPGRAATAHCHSIGGEICDVEMFRQRRDYPIGRAGNEYRFEPGAAVRLNELDALWI